MPMVKVNINEILAQMKACITAKVPYHMSYDEVSEVFQYLAGMENTIGGSISIANTDTRASADAAADSTFAGTADALATQRP